MTYVRLTKAEYDYLIQMRDWIGKARASYAEVSALIPEKVRALGMVKDAQLRQEQYFEHMERIIDIAVRVGKR
jgi:hypothetical protein